VRTPRALMAKPRDVACYRRPMGMQARWGAALGAAAAVVAAALAWQPAAAQPEQKADPAPKRRVYRVAAMGDSLTDPRSHGGKYLEYLRKRCPESRFDSYGIGG